jgi:hypothetical protein
MTIYKERGMDRHILNVVFIATLITVTQTGSASDVTVPNTFTAGTPAVAAEVNDNFSAVGTAINDNHTRITTLEGIKADARLTDLETYTDNPNISGNITLGPSNGIATGNIMKGTIPFLHNYGRFNTFLGLSAGNFTMDGFYNTANGYEALNHNTAGEGNTATGFQALLNNADGFDNTANGARALSNSTTGDYNTALGAYALFNTTGNGNTAIGYSAGYNLTDGVNNIDIDNGGVAGESHTIRIGDTQTRAFIAGIRGVTTGLSAIPVMVDSNGQLGTVSSSRRVKDHIRDMGNASKVLMQLRPVTFYYKFDHNPQGRNLQYGLIAEEVAEVAPQLVAHSKNGEIETVYYQYLTPMLLNEYQKQQHTIAAQALLLKQQAEQISALEQERRAQNARLSQLEQQTRELSALKAQVTRLATLLAQRQPARQIVAAQQ